MKARETVAALRECDEEVLVERGRLAVLDPDTGLRLYAFPEMGSWFGVESTWKDGNSYSYLVSAPMLSDGTPAPWPFDDRDPGDPPWNVGEVTAINEACAEEIALIETFFDRQLNRGCWSGR